MLFRIGLKKLERKLDRDAAQMFKKKTGLVLPTAIKLKENDMGARIQ